MKNNLKKVVAFGLAATMVFGSAMTVLAEDTIENKSGTAKEITGTAGVNGTVDKQVYSVTVPTDAYIRNAVSYKVDPQGLVAATAGAQYGPSIQVGTDKGVWFGNTSGDQTAQSPSVTGISNESDVIKITNKSARPLDLAVKITTTAVAQDAFQGTFATKSFDFSDAADKTANMYLAVSSTSEADQLLKSTGDVDFNNVILSAGYAYKTAWDGDQEKYTYTIDSSVTDLPVYELQFRGEINPDSDLTKFLKTDGQGKVTGGVGMPTVKLTVTPTIMASTVLDGVAVWDGETLYLGKDSATDSDGGFGTTKPTSVIVNGKNVATIGNNDSGYGSVTWESIWKAYGYTKAEDIPDEDALYNGVTAVKFVVDGKTYFAEVSK